ncbi:MAG: ATP-binding cassette domain-containing protein, partial [bacterium]|nr:ATP-binding cassette domain-containing protein [bacterium]
MNSPEIIIKIQNLDKSYYKSNNTINALQDINLQIREGDFTSIMGPSGSGKTTLLNLMGCLDKPTKGSLFFQGKNITYF